VHFSGDFLLYPADTLISLEAALDGISARSKTVETCLKDFYSADKVETPGLMAADFTLALSG